MPQGVHNSVMEGCTNNVLGAITEEAAVGSQLLALRAANGHSRFLLLPSAPEEPIDDSIRQQATATAQALEIRIVVPELIVIGPTQHQGHQELPCKVLLGVARQSAQRVAKVYYKRCVCTVLASQFCMVIPQVAFDSICSALDNWAAMLPP